MSPSQQTPSPDEQLLKWLKSGEPKAWQTLVQTYQGRLFAFAYSRLRDESLAEDVVQESLMGLLRALPNYNPETPMEAFLFSITAHKIIDQQRKLGRRQEFSSPELLQGQSLQQRFVSSMARSRERQLQQWTMLKEVLAQTIADLKTQKQWERLQCGELLFARGLRNREIAELMAISEQQVANHKQFYLSRMKQVNGLIERDS